MIYYLVTLFDNTVSVYECSETERTVLKNMGEESQRFEYEEFWEWWKKKVEYQGEYSIFVIATDQNIFDVPDDINISSTANIDNEHSYLFDNLPKGFNLITKPEEIQYTVNSPKKTDKLVKKVPRNNNSLEDYYIKKTKSVNSG